jgi:hypothetical protein
MIGAHDPAAAMAEKVATNRHPKLSAVRLARRTQQKTARLRGSPGRFDAWDVIDDLLALDADAA